jgi:hypothetical protein
MLHDLEGLFLDVLSEGIAVLEESVVWLEKYFNNATEIFNKFGSIQHD